MIPKNIRSSTPRQHVTVLGGGLDYSKSNLEKRPGEILGGVNYVQLDGTANGYKSAKGYERFDGRPSPSDEPATEADHAARDALRAAIQPIPGSGETLGIHYNSSEDVVYGWRNNAADTYKDLYKSSPTGWSAIATSVNTCTKGGTVRAVSGRFSKYESNSLYTYYVDEVSEPHIIDEDYGGVVVLNTPDDVTSFPTHISIWKNRTFLAYPGGHLLFSELGDPMAWGTEVYNEVLYSTDLVTGEGTNWIVAANVSIDAGTFITREGNASVTITNTDGTTSASSYQIINTNLLENRFYNLEFDAMHTASGSDWGAVKIEDSLGEEVTIWYNTNTEVIGTVDYNSTNGFYATATIVKRAATAGDSADAEMNTIAIKLVSSSDEYFKITLTPDAGADGSISSPAIGVGNEIGDIQLVRHHKTVSYVENTTTRLSNPVTGLAGSLYVGGDILEMIVSKNESIIITTSNGVKKLRYYESNSSDFLFKLEDIISDDSGLKDSAVEMLGDIHYLNNNGLVSLQASAEFGDFNSSSSSDRIYQLYKRELDNGDIIGGVRDSENSAYLILWKTAAPSLATYAFCIVFAPDKTIKGITVLLYRSRFVMARSGNTSTGAPVLLAGDESGYVYKLNTGTSLDGNTLSSSMELAYNNCSTVNYLKKFIKVIIEGHFESGEEFDLNCNYRNSNFSTTFTPDGTSTNVYGQSLFSVGTYLMEVPIRITGFADSISLEFSKSSKYAVQHLLQNITTEFVVTKRRL